MTSTAHTIINPTVTLPTPLTADRLLSAPLPELLVEANAEIIDAPRRYPNFAGTAIQRYAGRSLVVLPKGSSPRDREALVRELVGRLLGGAQ